MAGNRKPIIWRNYMSLRGVKSSLTRPGGSGNGRYLLASSLVLAILVAPFAIAKSGDPLRGGKRNPTRGDFTTETKVIAKNGTYGTRQSNKKDGDGGGAIYGCRSAPGREPCIRANNLKTGRAFEFDTQQRHAGRLHRRRDRRTERERDAVRHQRRRQGREPERRPRGRPARGRDRRPGQGPVGSGGRRRALTRKNGASAATKLGAGDYEVVFGGNVSTCAYNATLGSTDTSDPPAGRGGRLQRARKRECGARGDARQRRRRGGPAVPPDGQLLIRRLRVTG